MFIYYHTGQTIRFGDVVKTLDAQRSFRILLKTRF